MRSRVAERIISVGGGKGGVGKSVVATNLAVAMADEGKEVVLVDADLGAANLHTLLGLEKPGPTIQSFLEHEVESLEMARVATRVPRLSLVRGAGAIPGAANINHGQKMRLLRNIAALEAQIIIVDVGAGAAYNQLDLFDMADQKLVVMTPQLTSLQNAYGFVKGAVYRVLSAILRPYGFEELLDSSKATAETAQLQTLLKDAYACSPKLKAEVQEALSTFRVRLFGNQVIDPREGTVFRAVGKMMADFLNISAPLLGFARATRGVHDSVNRRKPFLLDAKSEETATAMREAAHVLLEEAVGGKRLNFEEAVAQMDQPAQPVAA